MHKIALSSIPQQTCVLLYKCRNGDVKNAGRCYHDEFWELSFKVVLQNTSEMKKKEKFLVKLIHYSCKYI